MDAENVFQMDVSKVYPLLVNKAVKKGRAKAEADEVTCWLTGYSQRELERLLERPISYADFFQGAPALHENRKLIRGAVCGVKVEETEDELTPWLLDPAMAAAKVTAVQPSLTSAAV